MNQQRRLTRRKPKRHGHKCAECANALFVEEWGEYKCKVFTRYIPQANEATDCEHWTEKKKEN